MTSRKLAETGCQGSKQWWRSAYFPVEKPGNWWHCGLLGFGDGGPAQSEWPIRWGSGNRKLFQDIMAGRRGPEDSRKGIITWRNGHYKRLSWLTKCSSTVGGRGSAVKGHSGTALVEEEGKGWRKRRKRKGASVWEKSLMWLLVMNAEAISCNMSVVLCVEVKRGRGWEEFSLQQ